MRVYNNDYSSLYAKTALYGPRRIARILIATAFIFLTVCEFLPFISSINARIVYSIKLLMIVFFFLGVLSIQRNQCLKYVIVFLLAMIFNVYMYLQVFYRYDISIMFVLTRSSMCWLYILMGLFLSEFNDKPLKNRLRKVTAVLICITSVTTIIGLQRYPEASRSIGNGVKLDEIDTISLYRMNVAPWGLIFAMAISLAFWIFEYRKTKKTGYLFVSIIATACVLKSQLTFAVLFSAFIWGAVILFYKSSKLKVILSVFVAFMVGILFYANRIEIMLWLSKFFESIGSQTLQRRFFQLYISFLYGEWFGDSRARFDLYFMSLKTFFENPIFGYRVTISDVEFSKIGMHSTLFDALGATGILGATCILPSFIVIVKNIWHKVSKEYRFVSVISIGIIVLLNIINPTYKSPQVYYAAFIIPLFYTDEHKMIAEN